MSPLKKMFQVQIVSVTQAVAEYDLSARLPFTFRHLLYPVMTDHLHIAMQRVGQFSHVSPEDSTRRFLFPSTRIADTEQGWKLGLRRMIQLSGYRKSDISPEIIRKPILRDTGMSKQTIPLLPSVTK